jgi:DNA-binding transcriptional ArsR family regulator
LVNLQELIVRGRIIFDGANRRLRIFELVNGQLSTREIARKAGRGLSSVDQDVEKLRDMELIQEKRNDKGNPVKKDGSKVYQKTPLIRHIPISYFSDVAETKKLVKKSGKTIGRISRTGSIHIPSENEILDICKEGEDQLYEFKAPGVAADKVTKEISGFLHTKGGGVVFYGIEDDGSIIGTDIRRQDFDQKIQNSVRNTISPPPFIEIKERKVMGSSVLLVVIPPWDRKTIYQNTLDSRYYIRRGTNVFALKPDELRKLSQGAFVA